MQETQNTRDVASISGSGSGRSPGRGNSNPLQYSCLGNHMDRGTRQATVHGIAKSPTQLSDSTTTNINFAIGKFPQRTKWFCLK